LKHEIQTLQENVDKQKKETKFFMKEAKKLEVDSKNIVQEKEEMKIKFEKLHRITHGKFKDK
jgi:hypothetical protein